MSWTRKRRSKKDRPLLNCTLPSFHADASASIFTKDYKSVPVADKGWKEGEP
jgi:hypothetical protein